MAYNIKKIMIITVLFVLVAGVCRAQLTVGGGLTFSGVGLEHNIPMLLTLGDSLTEGAFQTEGTGYRCYLYPLLTGTQYKFVGNSYLRQKTYTLPQYIPTIPVYDFKKCGWHGGVSGETTAQIETRTLSTLTASFGAPVSAESIVLLRAGTNDRGVIDPDGASATPPNATASVQNMLDIIDIIKAYGIANGGVDIAIYVSLIPPAGDFDIGTWQDNAYVAFNTLLSSTLATAGYSKVYIVDHYAAIRDVANCNPVTACFHNTLHFNDVGYQVDAQTWATAILANE